MFKPLIHDNRGTYSLLDSVIYFLDSKPGVRLTKMTNARNVTTYGEISIPSSSFSETWD